MGHHLPSPIGPSSYSRGPDKTRTPLPTSKVAEQVPSKGSLLSEIQAKHRPNFTGFLGKIEAYFSKRAVKSEYLEGLSKQFVQEAEKQGSTKAEAIQTFNRTFRPYLSDAKLEDMALFEPLLTTPEGIKFCMENLKQYDPKKVDAEGVPFGNPNREKLAPAFALLPRTFKLIGRLAPKDQREYLEAWILNGRELAPDKFKALVQAYSKHLKLAEDLQSRRPEVFDQGSKERWQLFNSFGEIYGNSTYSAQVKRIALFDTALRDTTVIDNRQILMYAIMGLYLGPTRVQENARAIPEMTTRSTSTESEASFGLQNQIHIPSILEGPDSQILEDFNPTMEVYLTDPFSLETRAVRLSLPVTGTMTVGEARKQLRLLKDVVNNRQEFETSFAKLGLDVTRKEEIKKKFLKFDQDVTDVFGRALGDFNSTPTRPRETTAREDLMIAPSIRHPESQPFAINAAAQHHVFLLRDNKLSLIPSGPGENHRGVGTLSDAEVAKARDNFLANSVSPVAVAMPLSMLGGKLQTAKLSISSREELIDGQYRFLVMETKIEGADRTITRKSYYRITQDRTVEDVKKETAASRLFERDLLLAKADFMEKVTRQR